MSLPSFQKQRPQPDPSPRRYKDAPTTVNAQGYVFEWCPTHPRSMYGTIQQHRLVMEVHLGRFLRAGQNVHHLNQDKTDNRIENLRLFASWSEHMKHHHKAYRADPDRVEKVRQAAGNPDISFASLGMSPTTVRAICREHNIHWRRRGKNARAFELDEQSVRAALRGRTTIEAAAVLGCHPMTLYNKFDHLLSKRTKPGALDPYMKEIYDLRYKQILPIAEIASRYGVSETCVARSLQRWKKLRVRSKQDAKWDFSEPPPRCRPGPKPGFRRKAQNTDE